MASKPTGSTTDAGRECSPLFDACTPFLYVQNAFRITGLPPEATTRDIKRRIDDLKAASDWDEAASETTHAFALDPPPTAEHIRSAAQRLQDPQRRIVDEFFWFWPYEWGTGYADPSLSPIQTADKDHAFELWRTAEADGTPSARVVATHNLAVMYHLVALDSEQDALTSDLGEKQIARIASYWRECFKRWELLTGDEDFWSYVTGRIRALDDPRLTTGFARRLRRSFPEGLDKINAMLAVSFAEKSKFQLAARHITYMRETHAGQDNIPRTLATIVQPIKARINAATAYALTAARRAPEDADAAARQLLDATHKPLQVLEVLYSRDDHSRIDLFDEVAETCLTCQVAYARSTEDWPTCRDLLSQAAALAHSEEVKARIQENLGIASQNDTFGQYFIPLVESLRVLTEASTSCRNKFGELRTVFLPQLDSIGLATGNGSDVHVACCDALVQVLGSLSVQAHNAEGDDETALAAIRLAAGLARDPDIKKRLENDACTLQGITSLATFTADLRSVLDGRGTYESKLTVIEQKTAAQLRESTGRSGRDEIVAVSVQAVRALAIKTCNEDHDHAFGLNAIDTAIGLENRLPQPDAEVIRQLQQDRAIILKNQLMAAAIGAVPARPIGRSARPASTAIHAPQSKSKSSKNGWAVAAVIGVVALILYGLSQRGTSSSTTARSGSPARSYTPPPRPAFNEPELALPYNGWVQRYHATEAIAPLQIVTRSSDQNYFVKVADYYSGRTVATVFVRGGQTVQIDVPTGYYGIKYAAGRTWYGTTHLFGPSTAYSKAEERFDFHVEGNQVSGYTVELYLQANGNLRMSRIASADF